MGDPPQHPDLCVELLDDAVAQGLVGVEISSAGPGVELSDTRLVPVRVRAAETGAIVFLHPFGCTPSAAPVGCSLDERAADRRPPPLAAQASKNQGYAEVTGPATGAVTRVSPGSTSRTTV